MKELTSRQQQALDTKLRISEAAMHLFKNTPYELIKINDICKAANVSVGTFYHYFESKDALIKSSYNSIDALIIEDFEEKPLISYIDAIEELNKSEASIVASLGANFTANGYIQILMDDSQYTISPYRLVHMKLMELLEGALEKKELINTDIEALAEYINRTARGNIFDWCLKRGTTNLVDTWTSDIRKILMHYKNSNTNID